MFTDYNFCPYLLHYPISFILQAHNFGGWRSNLNKPRNIQDLFLDSGVSSLLVLRLSKFCVSSSGATFLCPRSANANKILCIIQSIFFTSLSFLERVESDVQTLFCKFHHNCTHTYQKGFPLCVDFILNTTLQGQTRNVSLWNFAHEN